MHIFCNGLFDLVRNGMDFFEIHPHVENSTDVLIDMFEVSANELRGKRK